MSEDGEEAAGSDAGKGEGKKRPTCFVIMPMTTPPELVDVYGGDSRHFEHVLNYLFKPAIKRAGFRIIRPGSMKTEIVQIWIMENLQSADMVLCDISTFNPNVFFELGVRTALNKPVILVRDTNTAAVPFDSAPVTCHQYVAQKKYWSIRSEIERLERFIKATKDDPGNVLWKYFNIVKIIEAFSTENPMRDALQVVMGAMQRQSDLLAQMPRRSSSISISEQAADESLVIPPLDRRALKETVVLDLLAADLLDSRIARRLKVLPWTVPIRIEELIAKHGVANREKLVALAKRRVAGGD